MGKDIKNRALLGRRIAAARKLRGYTQTELADKVGVHLQTISKYERALQVPDAEVVFAICMALDVSADFLLGLSDSIGGKQ